MKFKWRNVFISIFVGLIIYYTQNRVGMTIIGAILSNFVLNQDFKVNVRVSLLNLLIGGILFIVGHWISLYCALKWVSDNGQFVWTFSGGFINGMIEMGLYSLMTIIPIIWLLNRSFRIPIYSIFLVLGITLFGAFLEAIYVIGIENVFYV